MSERENIDYSDIDYGETSNPPETDGEILVSNRSDLNVDNRVKPPKHQDQSRKRSHSNIYQTGNSILPDKRAKISNGSTIERNDNEHLETRNNHNYDHRRVIFRHYSNEGHQRTGNQSGSRNSNSHDGDKIERNRRAGYQSRRRHGRNYEARGLQPPNCSNHKAPSENIDIEVPSNDNGQSRSRPYSANSGTFPGASNRYFQYENGFNDLEPSTSSSNGRRNFTPRDRYRPYSANSGTFPGASNRYFQNENGFNDLEPSTSSSNGRRNFTPRDRRAQDRQNCQPIKDRDRNQSENRYVKRREDHREEDQIPKRRNFIPKSNGLQAMKRTMDFDKMIKMNEDELAVYLNSNHKDLELFLWKTGNHNQDDMIKLFSVLSRFCQSSCTSILEKVLFDARKIFDREDVKQMICFFRLSDRKSDKVGTIMNLLVVIKGLTLHTMSGPAQLLQTLDSLKLCLDDEPDSTENTESKQNANCLVSEIRELWKNATEKKENKLAGLSILPTLEEIYHFNAIKIEKSFDDCESYLRRLFLVYRQDFVRPLCRGIMDLRRDLQQDTNLLRRIWRHDDIRVYKDLTFDEKCCNNQKGITWRIHLDVEQYSRVNWSSRKLLMHGSLVCIVNVNFDFIHYATVADRNNDDLKYGYLEIKFIDEKIDVALLGKSNLLLLESQAFFPSFYYTLKVIKELHYRILNNKDTISFGDQIAASSIEAGTPEYFKRLKYLENGFDIKCLYSQRKQQEIDFLRRQSLFKNKIAQTRDFNDIDKTENSIESDEAENSDTNDETNSSQLNSEKGWIDVSNFTSWPDAEALRIDDSQYQALLWTLNRKLALIQGPPGTGKTVIGLKITELLLRNQSIWRYEGRNKSGPILLLSYTNHALDQFLLDITKRIPTLLPRDVVRLGSRTDEEDLKRFNLAARRQEVKTDNENDIRFAASSSRRSLFVRKEAHDDLRKLKRTLLSGIAEPQWLKEVADVMCSTHFQQLRPFGNNRILVWLLPHKLKSLNQKEVFIAESEQEMFDENEFEWCEEHPDRYSDDSWDELPKTQLEYGRLNYETLQMTNLQDYLKNSCDIERPNIERVIRNKLKAYKGLNENEVISINEVWRIPVERRWRLYRYWLDKCIENIDKEIRECEESFERAQKRYDEVRLVADLQILREAQIIACTTSRAAFDVELLNNVSPSIIILEEAAEIPEHHVISCLTQSCQHLIMIGDHQQLRPSYNDYHTAKEHKINLSLFERLISKGVPFCRLSYQHRMRPEISRLLVPHIYKDLKNDKSVEEYSHVKGIEKDLYFISHTEFEDANKEELSRSHKNTHEAEFIRDLYKYLRLQGYSSSEITVLSTYLDQVRLLQNLIRPVENELQDLLGMSEINFDVKNQSTKDEPSKHTRITAVDNFQGEENDIILLSLVRSNANEKIGYLKEANRICVALSRAKIGFYVIGNFDMLKGKSEVWRNIVEDTERKGYVGTHLTLLCKNHRNKALVKNAADFKSVDDGGCSKPCNFRQDCGHICPRKCHPDDNLHSLPCQKKCNNRCNLSHPCNNECHFPFACKPCKENVLKPLPACGHMNVVICSENLSAAQCTERCNKMLPCDHRCQRKCSEPCNTEEDCNELIKVTARCGHEVQVACHTKNDPPCRVPCRDVLKCGHKCEGTCSECSQGRLHVPCGKQCNRNLVCGHICQDKCNFNCQPCKGKCERTCPCDAEPKCINQCGESCIPCKEPCNWKCRKGCPNNFACSLACGKICDRQKCNSRCNRNLPCFHKCVGLRCEKCICKPCVKENFTEIFFGQEDEDGAVFIQLDECRCIFEVRGLDQYIDTQMAEMEENELRYIKCPKCQKKISRSSRYRNEIKIINQHVEGIYETLRKRTNGNYIEEKKTELSKILSASRLDRSVLRKIERSKLLTELHVIENQFLYSEEVDCLQDKVIRADKSSLYNTRLSRLDGWIYRRRQRFADQEHEEFQLEISRINLIMDIHIFKKEFHAKIENKEFPVEIKAHLVKLESVDKLKIDEIETMRKMTNDSYSSLLGLTMEEKRMIKLAMSAEYRGSGHWYRCQNGHYYTIGECGMPMEQRKCPECDVTIGGTNHILSDQNDQAMDFETQ